jgi:hypothetical protein
VSALSYSHGIKPHIAYSFCVWISPRFESGLIQTLLGVGVSITCGVYFFHVLSFTKLSFITVTIKFLLDRFLV